MSQYSVWAVINKKRKVLATPFNDGTVEVFGERWDRKHWKEFVSQVNELYVIAESGETA